MDLTRAAIDSGPLDEPGREVGKVVVCGDQVGSVGCATGSDPDVVLPERPGGFDDILRAMVDLRVSLELMPERGRWWTRSSVVC
jgi:hypothetical protein